MNATLSRFAVLRIENDEEEKAAERARNRERAAALKAADKKKNDEKSKQSAEKIAARKEKASQERAELKALAFGGSKKHKKPSQSSGKTAQRKSQTSVKQEAPTEWIQRDENFVDDVYEQQLREALLASKLDYEEKKTLYKAHEKEAKEEHKMPKKRQQGKKGAVTLSLDEFNIQLSQPYSTTKDQPPSDEKMNDHTEDHFFEKITEEAKKISSYEKIKSEISTRRKNRSQKALEISDIPRLAQLEDDLNKAREEITALRQENEVLQEELLGVKVRNKRLCAILAQAEMREKAELLIDMEKLSTIKDELTAEVENLSSQLQQERSKTSALSTDSKKINAQKKRQDSIGK